MTITCSNCEQPYPIVNDDFIVACPHCGTRTFSPGKEELAAYLDSPPATRAAEEAE